MLTTHPSYAQPYTAAVEETYDLDIEDIQKKYDDTLDRLEAEAENRVASKASEGKHASMPHSSTPTYHQ